MEDVLASPDAKAAVLISAKPGNFIAGADINMLDSADTAEEVRLLCAFFENLNHRSFFVYLSFVISLQRFLEKVNQ